MLAPGRPAAYGPSTVAHLPLDGKTSEQTLAKARALVLSALLTGHGRPLLSVTLNPATQTLTPVGPWAAETMPQSPSVAGSRIFFIETDAEASLGVAGHARPKPELTKSPTRLALAAPTC